MRPCSGACIRCSNNMNKLRDGWYVLCCAVLCCAVLCCAVLCCAVPCRAMPGCAMLRCAVPCGQVNQSVTFLLACKCTALVYGLLSLALQYKEVSQVFL